MTALSDSKSLAPKTFVTLDGLRGIAAIFVVFWHIPGIGQSIVSTGFLAVDLFFILSGFVLAYRYQDKIRSGMSARQFITLRAIRLYPLYALGSALGAALFLLALLSGKPNYALSQFAIDVLFAALMLPNFYSPDGLAFPLNIPAWSLFYEMVINAVFAVALRHFDVKRLIYIVAAAGLLLVFEGLYFGTLRLTGAMPFFLYAVVRVVFGFFARIVIYRAFAGGWLPTWHVHPLLPCALLALTMFAPSASPLPSLAIVLVVYPIITTMALRTEPEGALKQAMAWLGYMSFPIYAIHSPLLAAARAVAGKVHLPVMPLQVAAVPTILLFAWLASQYFDAPVRRRLTQWVRGNGAGAGIAHGTPTG